MAAPERRTRPAVVPWRWHGRDICTTLDGGEIRFITRDILEAIDAMLPELEGEPTHQGPLREHATATSWNYDYAVSVLQSSGHPLAASLHKFLYSVVLDIEMRPGGAIAFEQAVSPRIDVTPDNPTLI